MDMETTLHTTPEMVIMYTNINSMVHNGLLVIILHWRSKHHVRKTKQRKVGTSIKISTYRTLDKTRPRAHYTTPLLCYPLAHFVWFIVSCSTRTQKCLFESQLDTSALLLLSPISDVPTSLVPLGLHIIAHQWMDWFNSISASPRQFIGALRLNMWN